MTDDIINKGRTLAFVSYLTLIGTLIAFFMNQDDKNEFTSFHVRQALGLWLLQLATGYIVGGFDSWMISGPYWMFFGVLFIFGIIGALTGKLNSVPLLGNFFQKLFNSIGK